MLHLVLATTTSIASLVTASSESIEFEYPGGTVQSYVDHARKLCPDLNVILMEEVGDLAVPAFRVTVEGQEGLPAGPRIIEDLLPTLVLDHIPDLGNVEMLSVNVNFMGLDELAQNPRTQLYMVGLSEEWRDVKEEASRRHVIALGLGEFLDTYSVNGLAETDLLAAVEAAMQGTVADLDDGGWNIRYHEPTHVAFISVPESRADAAEHACMMLREALIRSAPRDPDYSFGGDPEVYRSQLRESEAARAELKVSNERLSRDYLELSNTVRMLNDKILELEGRLVRAQAGRPAGGGGGGAAGGGGRPGSAGSAGGSGTAGQGGAGGVGGASGGGRGGAGGGGARGDDSSWR